MLRNSDLHRRDIVIDAFNFVFGAFDLTTHPVRDFWIAVVLVIVMMGLNIWAAIDYSKERATMGVSADVRDPYLEQFFLIAFIGMILAILVGFTYNLQSTAMVMILTSIIGIWRLVSSELLLTEEMQAL
jgi:uncharacterized membrane protein YidH (DUF202 family)